MATRWVVRSAAATRSMSRYTAPTISLLALLAGPGCAAKLGDGLVLEPERVAEVIEPKRAGGETDVIVLDVRSLDDFRNGHLRGALWLDLTTWSRLSRSPNKGFRDKAGWEERIGKLGIAADDRVLVYDGGEMTEAARIWYILQLFGAIDVVVIDGGFPGLRVAAEGKIVPGDPPTPIAKAFKPQRPSWLKSRDELPGIKLADKSEVRSTISSKTARILDARTAAEYEGRDAKHNPRAGRLPDAINIPHGQLLDARGRLKTAEELQKLLAAAGLKPGDAIVTHCQSGGRASLAALAAKRAGFADVSNYYMSFGEWAQDETCPLADAESVPQMGTDEHR